MINPPAVKQEFRSLSTYWFPITKYLGLWPCHQKFRSWDRRWQGIAVSSSLEGEGICKVLQMKGFISPQSTTAWVVQLDCPEDANTSIHRVGRTARYEVASFPGAWFFEHLGTRLDAKKMARHCLFLFSSEKEGIKQWMIVDVHHFSSQ